MARRKDLSGAPAPAGFDQSGEVFDRARRLAQTLAGGEWVAHITLITDEGIWRTGQQTFRPREDRAAGVKSIVQKGERLWVEDAQLDARFRTDPLVKGPPYVRFFAGAPIRLRDGAIPGALWVAAPEPRPYDPSIAAGLQDIADFIADEWGRAQSERAHEAMTRESRTTLRVLRSVIDSAPMTLLMLDRDLRILGASRRLLESRQLRRRDVVGKTLAEVIRHPPEWTQAFDRCLAGETVESDGVSVERSDGSVRWMRTEITPWQLANDEIGGLLIASHDITDMVEALDRSARSEERLKLALELSEIHVWEMDFVDRRLIKVGDELPFFSQPTTYESLLADFWSTSVDARDRPATMKAWNQHETEGTPYRVEHRTPRRDGKDVWALSSAKVITNEQGKTLRLVGALQNITERKLAEQALVRAKEEAEAATRAKSAFLATMSHEIRTPLNGVLGMAQAMARDELAENQRERLNVIHQSGEALLAILNDVLDLSKIEAGKLELEQAEFDLVELARGAYATFAATAQVKGLGFELSISRSARGTYVGDSVRVRQILYNLLSNALKFTDQGMVKVSVSYRRGRLSLTVADTGIGIEPGKLAQLFQKFEQADASTTRRFGGTGLGLAICRDLVEMMGGSISAQSKPGSGTTFVVELPLHKAAAARPRPQAHRPAARSAPNGRALRVLAAEDNTMNQLVLKTLLAQVGVEPEIVADGRAAIAAWEREPWDLILMDVQMPEMDGPTATTIIRTRERDEGRLRTHIVALTANAMEHQVAEYRAAGMDGFVAKPIEASKLYEAVAAAAERAEQRAANPAA